jgi:hypothetical protein
MQDKQPPTIEFPSILEADRLKGIVDRLDNYHQRQREMILKALVEGVEQTWKEVKHRER